MRGRTMPAGLAALLVAGALAAQPAAKIKNWPVPDTTWQPPAGPAAESAPESMPTTRLSFIGTAPCRLVDTRSNDQPPGYGPPSLSANAPRELVLTGRSHCFVPPEARAISLNVTAINPTARGNIRVYPADLTPPNVSTVNFQPGQNTANAAIVALSGTGAVAVLANVKTDLVLDTNGYFAELPQGLQGPQGPPGPQGPQGPPGPAGPSPWQVNGTMVYYNGGPIGLGTSTPPSPANAADLNVKLDLENGNIQLDAERGLVSEAGARVTTGAAGGTFRFIAANSSSDIAQFWDSQNAKKVVINHAGGIQFGYQKFCSILVGNTWRDNLLVPATWTTATCRRLQMTMGATGYQLGCIFEDDFSLGTGSAVPARNCGWD